MKVGEIEVQAGIVSILSGEDCVGFSCSDGTCFKVDNKDPKEAIYKANLHQVRVDTVNRFNSLTKILIDEDLSVSYNLLIEFLSKANFYKLETYNDFVVLCAGLGSLCYLMDIGGTKTNILLVEESVFKERTGWHCVVPFEDEEGIKEERIYPMDFFTKLMKEVLNSLPQ